MSGAGVATPAVVFDLFGVIAHTQSPAGQARILDAADCAGRAGDFWAGYWKLREPYDSGQVSAHDYWRALAGELGVVFSANRIAGLVAADCASWSSVDPAMTGLIETLAEAGVTLGLLSNLPAELADEFESRHAWLRLMASVGFSCRIGRAKPDPAVFEWCSRSLGVAARDILFFDDRAENVTAARAAGMAGHLFTGADAAIDMIMKATGAG
jgi:putative hydrolase of the HAD superfamily